MKILIKINNNNNNMYILIMNTIYLSLKNILIIIV